MNMQYQASGATRNKARGGQQKEKFMGRKLTYWKDMQ